VEGGMGPTYNILYILYQNRTRIVSHFCHDSRNIMFSGLHSGTSQGATPFLRRKSTGINAGRPGNMVHLRADRVRPNRRDCRTPGGPFRAVSYLSRFHLVDGNIFWLAHYGLESASPDVAGYPSHRTLLLFRKLSLRPTFDLVQGNYPTTWGKTWRAKDVAC